MRGKERGGLEWKGNRERRMRMKGERREKDVNERGKEREGCEWKAKGKRRIKGGVIKREE